MLAAANNADVSVSLPSDREIAFVRYFERSPKVLFDAWTQPEHIRKWWGCDGSMVIRCEVDLRVQGAWQIVLRMADGSDHPFHGIYREVIRPNRLVYTECYEMPQFGSPEWLTTVTFTPTGNRTELRHVILHKSREVRDGHLQAGMEAGTVQTLQRLHQHTGEMQKEIEDRSK